MTAPAGPHGIVLLDKPQGWTSHDVVGRSRRLLGTRKVGHAGTLDPMATGLLVLGVGQGTRLLTHLVGLDKTYVATIRLGQATTTDDAEGEALGEPVDASGLDTARIEAEFDGLRGPIEQVPSAVSAIKVDGQRAYARVRAGEEVELAARPVTISRFDVTAQRAEGEFLDLDVIVDCSSGTYIRALARDLGSELGVGGHLTALRRTRIGPFSVEEAAAVPPRGEDDVVLPIIGLGASASRVLPAVHLDAAAAIDLGHGKRPVVLGALAACEESATAGDGSSERLVAALGEQAGASRDTDSGAVPGLVAVAAVERGDRLRPILVIPEGART